MPRGGTRRRRGSALCFHPGKRSEKALPSFRPVPTPAEEREGSAFCAHPGRRSERGSALCSALFPPERRREETARCIPPSVPPWEEEREGSALPPTLVPLREGLSSPCSEGRSAMPPPLNPRSAPGGGAGGTRGGSGAAGLLCGAPPGSAMAIEEQLEDGKDGREPHQELATPFQAPRQKEVEVEPTEHSASQQLNRLQGKDELLNPCKEAADSPDPAKQCSKHVPGMQGDGIPMPQKVLFPMEHLSLKWQQTHQIGIRMQNLGNTCFLNSTVR
ncbi:uncharacterized protein LOC128854041 [Cuculus canorus]|uniref:uncharacterized protein LOC128854041 n=1 Tax=Cuculus canorus TaxID=55661 RepID=UPI0023AB19B7|nr:uncharacterized protein LOC128854041 [Cuculus canorus]